MRTRAHTRNVFAPKKPTCYRVTFKSVRFSILFLLAAAAGASVLLGCKRTPVVTEKSPNGKERVARARTAHESQLRALCASQDLPYPPPALFLRAFKQERILEIWGGMENAPLKLLLTFPLTASSGIPGPKRREGDRQIPEGCYLVDRFNPESKFHLSLGLNYPNASDRVFANPEAPGSDIFIHGSDRSIGCLAIGDEAIEKLFVLASDYRGSGRAPIAVHIFPAHFGSALWDGDAAIPDLAAFWENLRTVYASFEETRRLPRVEVDADGRYRLLR